MRHGKFAPSPDFLNSLCSLMKSTSPLGHRYLHNSRQVFYIKVYYANAFQHGLKLEGVEHRLSRRYEKLVASHSNTVSKSSSGVKALPDNCKTASHTQALWRFLSNARVDLPTLCDPLLAIARTAVQEDCDAFALCANDWSLINYNRHDSKHDRKKLTHDTDIGYDLQSNVLISDRNGYPLVSPVNNLVTAQGVWQSRSAEIQSDTLSHLDEATERMRYLEERKFDKPLVHIIDREADSVAHWRTWDAAGWKFLVRTNPGHIWNMMGKTGKRRKWQIPLPSGMSAGWNAKAGKRFNPSQAPP